jgi:hypothetical protein
MSVGGGLLANTFKSQNVLLLLLASTVFDSYLPYQRLTKYILQKKILPVLDAGSSGTRAYLYYWPEHSGDKRELLRSVKLLF